MHRTTTGLPARDYRSGTCTGLPQDYRQGTTAVAHAQDYDRTTGKGLPQWHMHRTTTGLPQDAVAHAQDYDRTTTGLLRDYRQVQWHMHSTTTGLPLDAATRAYYTTTHGPTDSNMGLVHTWAYCQHGPTAHMGLLPTWAYYYTHGPTTNHMRRLSTEQHPH
jgi:hypothetical protein